MNAYHQKGITESPANVIEYTEKAIKQDAKVLAFFRAHPGREFTPFQVQRLCLDEAPITSVRRSLTNLVYSGHLIKNATKADGDYNRLNHTWSLKVEIKQLRIF